MVPISRVTYVYDNDYAPAPFQLVGDFDDVDYINDYAPPSSSPVDGDDDDDDDNGFDYAPAAWVII